MGIRETLNDNRSVTVGAAIGVIVLVVIWIVFYSMSEEPGDLPTTMPTVDAPEHHAKHNGGTY